MEAKPGEIKQMIAGHGERGGAISKGGQIRELQGYLQKYETLMGALYQSLRGKPLPAPSEELFALFEKSGNRLAYEEVYFARRKHLTVAGMQAVMQLEKGGAAGMIDAPAAGAAEELEKILDEICRERCWALPAHVNTRENADWELTVDLFAAETAQTLAELSHILGAHLSKETRETIRAEILRRVLRPFMGRRPYAGWESEKSNWNAVCCGCVGAAAHYLLEDGCPGEKEQSMLKECLARVQEAIRCYPGSFSEDGACMEGLSYWEYGMSYYVMFALLAGGGCPERPGLLDGEKFRSMMEFQQKCFFPGGRTLSFSDGDSRGRFRVGLTARLAMLDSRVELPPLRRALLPGEDPCWRWAAAYRDWIWTREYIDWLEREAARAEGGSTKKQQSQGERRGSGTDGEGQPKSPEAGSHILPDAQWAIFRGGYGTAAAVKGGHNGEPHNHNDVGSFQYFAGGRELICDLGAGEYTKEYFGEGRYKILCNSSEGHSVPMVGGTFQGAGRAYRAEDFAAQGSWRVTISFADAYEPGLLRKLRRSFKFEPETGRLTVEDWFVPGRLTGTFTENLVTCQPVSVQGNRILFASGGSVAVTCPARSQGEEGQEIALRVQERVHRDHAGEEQRVFLIQWEVPFSPEGGRCVCCICPGEGKSTGEGRAMQDTQKRASCGGAGWS